MTGGEMIPITGAKAAQRALGDDAASKEALADRMKDSSALDLAAEAKARRVAVREVTRMRIMQPLGRMMGMSKDYFDLQFAEDLAAKLEDVPEENIVTPKGSIAGPALEGLRYSVDEAELKELYLNLLASASNTATASLTHPAYGETIRQISEGEVELLTSVLRANNLPIVSLRIQNEKGEGVDAIPHLLNLVDLDGRPISFVEKAAWVDNWTRLGLISVDYGVYMVDGGSYTWVHTRPEFKAVEAQVPLTMLSGERSAKFKRGTLKPTTFGRQFASAVLPEVFAPQHALPRGPVPGPDYIDHST